MQLIAPIALVVVAATGVLAQNATLHIDTPPSITECEPTDLTFGGGQPPYFLTVISAGQPGSAPLETLPQQTGNSFTWKVDFASGTSVNFQIKDSTGNIAFSAPVTVQAGTDSSCVGKNSASPNAGSATASSGTTGSGSPTSTSAPATNSSSASSPTVSSLSAALSATSTGTSASPTKPTSAASSGTSIASNSAPTKSNAASTPSSGSASGIIGMILAALLI